MEKLVVEEYLKRKGKNNNFIELIEKIFKDNNINQKKAIEILDEIYK